MIVDLPSFSFVCVRLHLACRQNMPTLLRLWFWVLGSSLASWSSAITWFCSGPGWLSGCLKPLMFTGELRTHNTIECGRAMIWISTFGNVNTVRLIITYSNAVLQMYSFDTILLWLEVCGHRFLIYKFGYNSSSRIF